VASIFDKGSIRERQQLLLLMKKLDKDKTEDVLAGLIARMRDDTLAPNIRLELGEAVDATGSETLKARLAALQPVKSAVDAYADALFGGDIARGRGLFLYSSTAQCSRCHAIGADGGKAGPELTEIDKQLSRQQILAAIVDPDARIAPGYGNVSLTLKDGQEVYGILTKESDYALTLTTSAAEPLVIPLARIAKRQNLPSGMPAFGETLSKRDIRDLVAFLASGDKK
jgi:quinoprotein glucose dehydrogenase